MPAQRLSLIWPSDPTRYAPARHRRACRYEAFVPAPLAELQLQVGAETMGLVSDAERAIHALNASAQPALAPLARLLLRTESIASSKVEGLRLGAGELARAEVRAEAGRKIGATALDVISNIDAMQLAVDHATSARDFTVEGITAIHARLMGASSESARIAGRVRTVQNWIGGNDYTPCGADFVPPPVEYVPTLLDDLCDAINDETLSPLIQAALVHAQFETIHPFDDGNGRTGRALIHVVLRRRGIAPAYVPPVSIMLAKARDRYIEGLTHFRAGRVEAWIAHFAEAAAGAATLARTYLQHVEQLSAQWHDMLRASNVAPRAGAAAWAVLEVLPGWPVITAPIATALTARAKAAVYEAIGQLVTAGVLLPLSSSPRTQSWEVHGLLELLAALEDGRAP